MEVYGGGYLDDVDYFNYNKRNSETHAQTMISQLNEVIQCYSFAIEAVEMQDRKSTLGRSQTYKSQFLLFLNYQKAIFERLRQIQVDKNESLDNDYMAKPEGHLVWVTCGHRGSPNRPEEKRISRLLRKSGFIPMLEEINAQKKEQEK